MKLSSQERCYLKLVIYSLKRIQGFVPLLGGKTSIEGVDMNMLWYTLSTLNPKKLSFSVDHRLVACVEHLIKAAGSCHTVDEGLAFIKEDIPNYKKQLFTLLRQDHQ